jgi:hypothetical protein
LKLAIVAPCYSWKRPPDQARHISESCQALSLSLFVYGLDHPWPGLYQGKVIDLRRAIEEVDSEFILVSDANDAFFLADEREILEKFDRSGVSVLVSGDKNCWPEIYLQQFYPPCSSPWRYVNSGGYIGHKESLLNLLTIMQSFNRDMIPFESDRDWQNDQFRLSLAYLTDLTAVGLTIGIDISCQVFQTMHTSGDELTWEENRLHNRLTDSHPCHLHFNGNWPGISEAFERRFACSEQPTTA